MTEEVNLSTKLDALLAQTAAEIVQAETTIQNLETRISRLQVEIVQNQDLLEKLKKV